MITYNCLVLGSLQTNCYLIKDSNNDELVIIDPADEADIILDWINGNNAVPKEIWITHAHFDHIGAASQLSEFYTIPIAIHPLELDLWNIDGGAKFFGLPIKAGKTPQKFIHHGEKLQVGNYTFMVKHLPGHTQGHVVFYCAAENLLISGDVLFKNSIGRTDLPGGNYEALINGIHQQLLPLPDETLVLPGHGEATTMGNEKKGNPFIINRFI